MRMMNVKLVMMPFVILQITIMYQQTISYVEPMIPQIINNINPVSAFSKDRVFCSDHRTPDSSEKLRKVQ